MPRSPRSLTLLNIALLLFTVGALTVLLVRSEPSPGVEVVRADPPSDVDEIRVEVRGAVAAPGVVMATPGDSVAGDVIERAGGALPDADLDALNLALRVRDEDVVHVPHQGEAAPALLDLNSATRVELEALPEIGPARAAGIIAGRPYASVDELVDRGVLSPTVYEAIRALVTAQ